ncbi:MAG TPA: hypothetical protein VFA59_24690 [Vicinamibacterales bacterium]|nr:hypothetical protein [Vicinamibacterales bacterium]
MDPQLLPYLQATGEESERYLAALLGGETDRTIRTIVSRTLCGATRGPHAQTVDADDVRADVVLHLLGRLRQLKTESDQSIENFSGYVASIAYRTCYTHLRRLYPQRARLKNRLRYALNYDPDLTLEQDAVGIWRCRLTAWATTPRVVSRHPDDAAAFRRDPRSFAREALQDSANQHAGLGDSVIALLTRIGEPIEFDALVDAMAGVFGIEWRPRPGESGASADILDDIADPQESALDSMVQQQYLQQLWTEVRELPLPQRRAILLNLRDEGHHSALPLLTLTGVATMRQIAEAIEMTPLELAAVWRDLPLDDARIAAQMQMTRQQVINLRKAGRQRLGRRMARFGRW